jgi:ankyrin repeat protein
LHRACEDGDVELVGLLLKKPAYYHCNQQDASGATPLHRAVEKGNIEIAKLLLAKEKIDISVKNKAGKIAKDLVAELAQEEIKSAMVNLFNEFEINKKNK